MSIEVPDATGITETKLLNLFNIYPNPSSEFITIEYKLSESINKGTIDIYNIFGNKIKTIEVKKENKKIHISTQDMINGLYFYTFSANGEVIAKKKFLVIK